MLRTLIAISAVAMLPLAGSAQDVHRTILAEKFNEALAKVPWELRGVMGICMIDLATGKTFGVNDSLVFPRGTAINVSVQVSTYVRQARAEMDVNQLVAITVAESRGRQRLLARRDVDEAAIHHLHATDAPCSRLVRR